MISRSAVAEALHRAHPGVVYSVWLIVSGTHRPFSVQDIRDRFHTGHVPTWDAVESALSLLSSYGLVKHIRAGDCEGWV